MADYRNFFSRIAYRRIILCFLIWCYLLLCYNGLWNMALYPAEAKFIETFISFMDACLMLTPATLIAASFGALSVLELVCTVKDDEWKTILEMILWSLLTILVNSFTTYLISLGNKLSIGIWMILVITSVVNIVWYISTIILLKSSKRVHKMAEKLEDNEKDYDEDVNMLEPQIVGTRDFVYNLLRGFGSNPQETDDGRIQFEYQGIDFLMEATDDCKFVNLIWPWCHSFSKFDIDEFARVRQVVNEINMYESLTVFYTFADSDDVALHIKKHFLLVSQIPEVEEYLKLILNSFFRAARNLDLMIEKCRMQECKEQV